MDNLPALRDIHLPEGGVPFFPLAYGWWSILVCVIAAWVLYKVLKMLWQQSAKIYARRILQSFKDDTDLAAAVKMSEILRRACVRKYPEAVAVSGDDWIAFLNSKSKWPLNGSAAELLKNAPFMVHQSYEAEDMSKVWRYCYDWIGENL